MWGEVVGVCPSSAPFLCELLCECMDKTVKHFAEHRALQAQIIHRDVRGAYSAAAAY